MKHAVCLPLLFAAATAAADPAALPSGIQSGDLIFRDGDEAISSVVRSVDSSGFSHVGLLEVTPEGVFVIHATPQEHTAGVAGVNRDPLDFFIRRARDGRIAYYAVGGDAAQHHTALRYALSQTGTPFSINPQDGVYCTELVAQAWQAAGLVIINGKTRLSLPAIEEPLILPENITRSPHVQRIP